eukprot:m.361199 g.361199  ORF g.361199 m.361199 type:complete len:220 (-) comp19408_c0_seq1:986-1645(-)
MSTRKTIKLQETIQTTVRQKDWQSARATLEIAQPKRSSRRLLTCEQPEPPKFPVPGNGRMKKHDDAIHCYMLLLLALFTLLSFARLSLFEGKRAHFVPYKHSAPPCLQANDSCKLSHGSLCFFFGFLFLLFVLLDDLRVLRVTIRQLLQFCQVAGTVFFELVQCSLLRLVVPIVPLVPLLKLLSKFLVSPFKECFEFFVDKCLLCNLILKLSNVFFQLF